MASIDKTKIQSIFKHITGKRVAVIGDFMIDRYFWGSVSRISPEAPVPIVEIERETEQLGGAANVANNIISLGAEPYPIGIIGDDSSGQRLLELIRKAGFCTEGIFVDDTRPTTIKTRIIADDQHVVRTDRESCKEMNTALQDNIYNHLESLIPSLDAIIIEDYNKGMLSQPLVTRLVELADHHRCITTVDPKFNHFFDYRHVTVFKPNRREAEQILATELNSEQEITRAGETLLRQLQCKNVLITLGADGMALFQNDGQVHRIPTRARRVHDVSGAGDTVISTLTAALTGGANIVEAATLANYAASIVIEEVGAVPIDKKKLIQAFKW